MTREEEIQRESDNRWLRGSANNQRFVEACKWVDQHPKQGLWDAEKVINFLKERATLENSSNINIHINGATYHFVNDFIEDLRKAMEE